MRRATPIQQQLEEERDHLFESDLFTSLLPLCERMLGGRLAGALLPEVRQRNTGETQLQLRPTLHTHAFSQIKLTSDLIYGSQTLLRGVQTVGQEHAGTLLAHVAGPGALMAASPMTRLALLLERAGMEYLGKRAALGFAPLWQVLSLPPHRLTRGLEPLPPSPPPASASTSTAQRVLGTAARLAWNASCLAQKLCIQGTARALRGAAVALQLGGRLTRLSVRAATRVLAMLWWLWWQLSRFLVHRTVHGLLAAWEAVRVRLPPERQPEPLPPLPPHQTAALASGAEFASAADEAAGRIVDMLGRAVCGRGSPRLMLALGAAALLWRARFFSSQRHRTVTHALGRVEVVCPASLPLPSLQPNYRLLGWMLWLRGSVALLSAATPPPVRQLLGEALEGAHELLLELWEAILHDPEAEEEEEEGRRVQEQVQVSAVAVPQANDTPSDAELEQQAAEDGGPEAPQPATDVELPCAICLDTACRPCCLPCGHTYCWACAARWVATQQRKCPQCRAPCQAQQLLAIV